LLAHNYLLNGNYGLAIIGDIYLTASVWRSTFKTMKIDLTKRQIRLLKHILIGVESDLSKYKNETCGKKKEKTNASQTFNEVKSILELVK